MNEKGSVAEAATLPRTPPGFAAEVDGVLSGLRPDPATLAASLDRMTALTARVHDQV